MDFVNKIPNKIKSLKFDYITTIGDKSRWFYSRPSIHFTPKRMF